MTLTGTSHFVSFDAAARYYADTEGGIGAGTAAAARKLDAGEIHIGPPESKPGDTLKINNEEGRYFIESK